MEANFIQQSIRIEFPNNFENHTFYIRFGTETRAIPHVTSNLLYTSKQQTTAY